MCFLQLSCSHRFKDGLWLERTIRDLQFGVIDTMKHAYFILNLAAAELRSPEFPGHDIHLGQLRCGHLTTEGCMQCAWQAASELECG